VIPDLIHITSPNISLLWTTLRDHYLPSTTEDITVRVQAMYKLTQGSGTVADFVNRVRRENQVLTELDRPQPEEQLKALISIGIKGDTFDNYIATLCGVPFVEWCRKLINFENIIP